MAREQLYCNKFGPKDGLSVEAEKVLNKDQESFDLSEPDRQVDTCPRYLHPGKTQTGLPSHIGRSKAIYTIYSL